MRNSVSRRVSRDRERSNVPSPPQGLRPDLISQPWRFHGCEINFHGCGIKSDFHGCEINFHGCGIKSDFHGCEIKSGRRPGGFVCSLVVSAGGSYPQLKAAMDAFKKIYF